MAATIQDQIGHFIRRGAFSVLEEMRVDLERYRRIGMAEAVLDFGDGRAAVSVRNRSACSSAPLN